MIFSEPLKKNKDFKTVYNTGRSRANKYLVMYVMKNGTEKNRLGVSVSKKVGNSVIRHRLKRQIKEIYRLGEDRFKTGLDIVVILRIPAKKVKYDQLREAVFHLAGIQKILKEG